MHVLLCYVEVLQSRDDIFKPSGDLERESGDIIR